MPTPSPPPPPPPPPPPLGGGGKSRGPAERGLEEIIHHQHGALN